jgi:hypothetical protein
MGIPYHGKTATAEWKATGGAFVAFTNLLGWSVTLSCGVADSTIIDGSTTGRTKIPNIPGGTASVTCKVGGAFSVAEGDHGTLSVTRDGTNASKGYEGTAICTGVEPAADIADVEGIVYNFQFSGTVTATVTSGSA